MTSGILASRGREDRSMSHLVTGVRLCEAVTKQTFIKGGEVSSVEGIKYDLHVGNRILKAAYTQPVDVDRLLEADRSSLCVEPGEVVFVLTKETLDLPKNMMAILSPKRTLAHGGIMILGGLMVDPNYTGVLWIGLYNFSSNSFPIRPGLKLIAAMFYELEGDEIQDFPTPEGDVDFPEALIELIKHYRPIELKGLQDQIEDAMKQIALLRNDAVSDKQWKEDFKKFLDEHSKQLGILIEGLKDEKEVRRQEDNQTRARLDAISSYVTVIRVGWIVVGLVIAAALGYWIPKLLGH
jgi:deoxycytidine triphosphate deaminase